MSAVFDKNQFEVIEEKKSFDPKRFELVNQDSEFDADSFEVIEKQPSARPTTGFIANLRDPRRGESGGLASFAKLIAGTETTEEKQKAKDEFFGKPKTFRQQEIEETLLKMENEGSAGSDEFNQLFEELKKEEQILDQSADPEFSFSAMTDAIKSDPGAFAAEFVNVLGEDPEFFLTPAGWKTAATLAGARATLAGATRAGITTARIAGGATGATAMGAAIQAPISTLEELQRGGEFDVDRVLKETALTAGISPIVVGGAKAVGKAFTPRISEKIPEQAPRSETVPLIPQSVGAAAVRDIKPGHSLTDAINKVNESSTAIAREIIDVTGGKAITPIRRLGNVSPTARKLANMLEPEERPDVPVSAGYFEATSRQTGRFITSFQDALTPIIGRITGRGQRSKAKEIVKVLRGEKVEGVSASVGKSIRNILNDFRDYMNRQGLDVGFVKDFFPRIYKRDILNTDQGSNAFARVLLRHGIDVTTSDGIVRKIINEDGVLNLDGLKRTRIDLDDPGAVRGAVFHPKRILAEGRAKKSTFELQRKLDRIPDSELAPFLEDDLYSVITRYIENGVRRAEYANRFGASEGQLNKMVADIIEESNQAGSPVRRQDIQRIYDLADTLQRNYRPIQSRVGKRLNTFTIAYQYLRTLPLATISSLSEPFIVLERGQFKAAAKAVPSTLRHAAKQTLRILDKRFSKSEATIAAEQAGLTLDTAIAERLTAVFGGESTKFTETFFKATLLTQWTRLNRVWANETAKVMVTDNLRRLSRGETGRTALRFRKELTDLGIDTTEGIKWLERGAKVDDPFYDNVVNAGIRFTNEVVMAPRSTVRPLWFSNPHLHIFSQLKGFQTTFGNTVMKRWYRKIFQSGAYEGVRNGAKIGSVGIIMISTAILGNEFREFIKFGSEGNPKTKDEPPEKTLVRAMDRAGFTGVFQWGLDALFAHRFGQPSVTALAGPTASQAEEVISGIGQAIEGKPRKAARAISNAIPIANVIPSVRKEIRNALVKDKSNRFRR